MPPHLLAAGVSANALLTFLGDTTFPAALGSLIFSYLLIGILGLIGSWINWREKIDDVLRLFVAVLAVAGSLALFPVFNVIADLITILWNAITTGAGWSLADLPATGVLSVISLIPFAITLWVFYKRNSLIALFALSLAAIPLFGLPFMHTADLWWITHLSVPGWRGLVNAFDVSTALKFSVSA